MRNKTKSLTLCILALAMVFSVVCAGLGFNLGGMSKVKASASYVELYSPLNDVDIVTADPEHLAVSIEEMQNAPHGRVLAMDYKPDHERSIDLAIPVKSQDAEGFQGLAMWVDVPETSDSYSFTLYVVKNSNEWQTMNLGSPLTLVSQDGEVTTKSSVWKRQHLNGFTGWVVMPQIAYADPVPQADLPYKFIIMFEKEVDASRSTPIKVSLGSIGYYTDYDAFLYSAAGEAVMDEHYISQLDAYIEQINALQAKSANDLAKKNKMLVHFANIKENYKSLSLDEKIETAKNLASDYSAMMQDFRYGEIKNSKHVMNFAITSDTHFTNNWVNENFLSALSDARDLDPNLTAMMVLGDLSDNGISVSNPKNSDLDNYYDWRDSFNYKNSKGESIPIISIMGNHDVRGPFSEGYPTECYQPAVDYYIEREGSGSLHFDKWINGYHFIFLNTDKYHSDNCFLSEQTLLWLDEKLGENEDGKPIFVMIHQPLGKVITMEGSSITFEEVMAKHPTAIVSSGHTHAHFGTAKITNEGKGVFVNQPAMVVASVQYYFVEVYEGGVIYRARQASTKEWLVDHDVVVSNADRRVNDLYVAESASSSDLTTSGLSSSLVTHSGVSSKAIKLNGAGSAEFTTRAIGSIENYGGYSIYAVAEKPVKVSIDGAGLKAGATYYALVSDALVEKTVGENGEIELNGWVAIPKDSIEGETYPTAQGSFEIDLLQSQIAYVDRIAFYFDKQDLYDAIYNLSYSFYDYDGSLISSAEAHFGAEVNAPSNPYREEDQAYSYYFKGWDLNFDGKADVLPTTLGGNITATAVYSATIKRYTYEFVDSDGSSIDSATVDYGTAIVEPKVEGVFGWDLDGDAAVESLPKTLTADLYAVAVYAPKQYENATVVFDAGTVSSVNFSKITYTSVNTTGLHTTYGQTRENELAPGGRVATYEYNYTDGNIVHTNSNMIKLATPYSGSTEGFAGFAIWVDVPATSESYIGGLRINNANSRVQPMAKGWTLIDSEGNVSYQDAKWENESSFPQIGTGFTGWILIDKTTFDYQTYDITPNKDGFIMFQIRDNSNETGRTTPYTMNIGQILFYADKDALVNELVAGDIAKNLTYSFTDGKGYVYKSGSVEEGGEIIIPENPVHEDSDMFFAGWDTNFDGIPESIEEGTTITKNLTAIAIFYHKNAFESIYDSTGGGFVVNSGKHVTLTQQAHDGAPSGYATKVSANPNGESVPQDQHLTINIPGARTPEGIAVWFDCTGLEEFDLFFWINLLPTNVIADGGDYCYLMGEDGTVTLSNRWRRIIVPANFKGWLIMPMTTFRIKNLMPGDVLRIGIPYGGGYNPVDFSCDFYLGECVIFNCPVESFMDQIGQRVYTFEDYDGRVISCGRLADGQSLPIPTAPEREEFSFLGWDVNGDGKVDEIPNEFGRNIVARAIYKSEKYLTYKFVEEGGTVILEREALYGSLILPPFRFEKAEGIYEYIPNYEGYTEGMILTEDIEFTVTYTKQVRQLTYSFVVDGAVVKSETVDCGTVIVAPSDPVKASEQHYSYNFVGWNGFTAGMTAEDDYLFEAIFERTPVKYTVTFKNGEEIHHTEQVAYGEAIILPATPEKEGEEQYVYEFSGWLGYTTGMTVSGDVTFEAVFDKVVRTFTINFLDSDGVTIIASKKVPYGSRVNPPAAPYKEGYEFVTWENYYGMAEVTEDASYKAIYKPVEGYNPDSSNASSDKQDEGKKSCKSSVMGVELGLALLGACVVFFARKQKGE